ncbi:AAA family ATPase [Anaerospora sp.]|uniref:AAA family ATPase n=1 Tax=Anaerospora sp. TaxID=1960278 RepID=UPI0028A1E8A1|nr:AAA family ATPase [Anaerospora sp.]
MKSPYISKVSIKNYRNFKNAEVDLAHKQVIIGENNIGKTNFLRAIQLILDPRLSEYDRMLNETDFFDGLKDPMKNGEEIQISLEIQGFKHNTNLLAQLSDASIKDDPATLKITYKFYPIKNDDGSIKEYTYKIYKGNKEDLDFTYHDRKYLNVKVINALRDVESELKSARKSPITRLLEQYKIDKDEITQIAETLKSNSAELLELDELMDLEVNINRSFSKLIGLQPDPSLSLETIDIDPNRLLNALKVMIGAKKRPISESSLGLNNILYISLILLALEDKTIPTYLKKAEFDGLVAKEDKKILRNSYATNEKGNYTLRANLSVARLGELYAYMDKNNPIDQGFTILAIEEPEAHIHPSLQRIIYKEIINDSSASVLLTTHSTHIASVAPINSIVHLSRNVDGSTLLRSSAKLQIAEEELVDLERYIDASRGEIYFGKGVILVEGIAEDYLVPQFAEIMELPLDEYGIVICNINSTNFKPYANLLEQLGIPFVIITDGDIYEKNVVDGGKIETKFHVYYEDMQKHGNYGFLGHDNICNLMTELKWIDEDEIPESFAKQDELFQKNGCFVGIHTLEVDIMDTCYEDTEAEQVICDVYDALTPGGTKQKANFKAELENAEYWKCLKKIEGKGIGKGRFSQRLASSCTESHIPGYVEKAIKNICQKVNESCGA